MAKVRDYHKLALDIIDVVGGQKNIVNATRCATRLRLVLKETPEGAKEKVSALAGVITVVENNGQFQVVIGTHVGEVYDSVAEALHLDASAQEIEQPKQNIVNRIIATMSAVFAPFVYILAAAGLLQGALILITMAAPSFAETGTYEVLNFMSWTPFTFLPIFIAITASKHFKCNTYIAILCCCALVNQSWADIAARIADGDVVRFLGVKLSETTYTSTVLPPLLLVWVLSYLEHFIEKKLPDAAKPLLIPLICFVVMVPATIMVIGPASAITANAIANGYNALVAFAPALAGTEDALDSIMSAIKAAGYEPGKDVKIGMDCASSEFFKNGIYDYSIFEGENGKKRTADEQIAYLEDLINNYPIDSIEDGMSENDWEGWKKLTERIGNRCQLVGDDLFVTNVEFLEKGIAMGCANSILIKVNQIGSLSETLDAIEMAHRHGYTTVTSHRSGETEDATIADIAVATNSGQIKTGSLSRSDRMAKYNQLLRIEEELGNLAVYGYKRIK